MSSTKLKIVRHAKSDPCLRKIKLMRNILSAPDLYVADKDFNEATVNIFME